MLFGKKQQRIYEKFVVFAISRFFFVIIEENSTVEKHMKFNLREVKFIFVGFSRKFFFSSFGEKLFFFRIFFQFHFLSANISFCH